MIQDANTALTVEKPWGRERWLVHEGAPYAMKILEVRAGQRLSLQYHRLKQESSYCLSGRGTLVIENPTSGVLEERPLSPHDYYTILPKQIHRVIAITDLALLEVSTPHLNDVVRIEDDTGRIDQSLTVVQSLPFAQR